MNRYEMAEIVAKAAEKYGSVGLKDKGAIMKKHGINWIRLRIWNDPVHENGSGYTTAERALAMTQRAHALARAEGAHRFPLQRFLGGSRQAVGAEGLGEGRRQEGALRSGL